jgi:hypothetical protein
MSLPLLRLRQLAWLMLLLLLLQLTAASSVGSSVDDSTSTAVVTVPDSSNTVPESSNSQSSLPEAQAHRQLFWSLVFLGRLPEAAVVSLAGNVGV